MKLYRIWVGLIVILAVCVPIVAPAVAVTQGGDPAHNEELENGRNLVSAIKGVPLGEQLTVAEGTYWVENPVILRTPGVRIIGADAIKSVIRPRNAGQPVFILAADDITVESIGIDSRTVDGTGRATFAFFIESDISGCNITATQIVHTAATAVLGDSVSDCAIRDNVIIDAGDDGVRLRGDRLDVSRNRIERIFDEAIDLASGESIIVRDNRVQWGRIGITVGDSEGAVVMGNIVEEQFREGMATGGSPSQGAVVVGNVVRDSHGVAYNLDSPSLVMRNRAEGENYKVGFLLKEMIGGLVQGNVVTDSKIGFQMTRSMGTRVEGNPYCPSKGTPLVIGEGSWITGTTATLGCDKNIGARSHQGRRGQVYTGLHEGDRSMQRIGEKSAALFVEQPNRMPSLSVETKGETARDRAIADMVADEFSWMNPGFRSVRVGKGTMWSEIDPAVYTTLLGGGDHVIGVVRAPFLVYQYKSPETFPLWRLIVDDKEMAVVYKSNSPSSVSVRFLQDGNFSLADHVAITWQKLLVYLKSVL